MPDDFTVFVTRPGTDEQWSANCAGVVVAGRSSECDLVLDHPVVSRRHAELAATGDGELVIRDLGSHNGTTVGDRTLHGSDVRVPGRASRYRGDRPAPTTPNVVWAMDVMADTLFDGRPFRILTVVDCPTRESLAIVPRTRVRASHVVDALDAGVRERGRPTTIRCDNGPEFAGRLLDQWAYFNRVGLDFSRPATPTDNAFIESFNARLRQECLNASWFLSVPDARFRLAAWRRESNEERPHSALGNLTPQDFVDHARAAPEVAEPLDQHWGQVHRSRH